MVALIAAICAFVSVGGFVLYASGVGQRRAETRLAGLRQSSMQEARDAPFAHDVVRSGQGRTYRVSALANLQRVYQLRQARSSELERANTLLSTSGALAAKSPTTHEKRLNRSP